jgi:hypothetical protein
VDIDPGRRHLPCVHELRRSSVGAVLADRTAAAECLVGERCGEAIEQIAKLSHNDSSVDHIVVDTRNTVAEGKPLRAMAEEVGMLDLYRLSYQLQSGVTHSEWWSVEEHAMERCMNILHRDHLIPSLSLSYGGNVDLARSWIIGLYALMRMSLNLLGTDESAVTDAFAWLHPHDDEQGVGPTTT